MREFEKYTVQHNVAYCDRIYENLSLAYESVMSTASGISAGYKVYDFVDDPFGYVLGEATDNIIVDAIYRIGKIAWGVFTGDITDVAEAVADEAMGDIVEDGINTYTEQLQKDAKILKEQADNVRAIRNIYTRRLADFKEDYFWEIFF